MRQPRNILPAVLRQHKQERTESSRLPSAKALRNAALGLGAGLGTVAALTRLRYAASAAYAAQTKPAAESSTKISEYRAVKPGRPFDSSRYEILTSAQLMELKALLDEEQLHKAGFMPLYHHPHIKRLDDDKFKWADETLSEYATILAYRA